LFYANKYQKATERYDNIGYDPSYLKALLNKGIALNKLGKYKEAIKWYDKALLIEPNAREIIQGKKCRKRY
jgi:tetratricopeptide (TPR) repeat protein